MSAANRGVIRATNDLYPTPGWLTEGILSHLDQYLRSPMYVLEPAAGAGAIMHEMTKRWPGAHIDGIDIDPSFSGSGIVKADFLTLPPRPEYDLIISNPPYSLALQFIQTAMKWRRDEHAPVVMLLRLNFLGGQRRAPWLRANMTSVYVSPRRPSFTAHGTEATEYSWLVWNGQPPTIHILETEAGA